MMAKSLLGLCLVVLAYADETKSDIDVGLRQICIWLPIVLVITVGSAIYQLVYMDQGRDSLLNAKFIIAEPNHERR